MELKVKAQGGLQAGHEDLAAAATPIVDMTLPAYRIRMLLRATGTKGDEPEQSARAP